MRNGSLAQAAPAATEKVKPALRGWSHLVAAVAVIPVGILIGLEARGTKAQVCASVACASIVAMLATSAAFHRVRWKTPEARRRMRRADHAAIFVCIAGSYTGVAGLSLPDTDAWIILGIVWGGSVAGIVMRFWWLDAPKWAVALPYIAVGWVAVGALPEFWRYLGGLGFSLMCGGGVLYTVGALVYARRRPDPWPAVFGYHEIFHACVVAAAGMHLALIAFVLLPAVRA